MPKKRIFISCGQRLPEEKSFGREIQRLINENMDGFFAEEAHDAADLNTSLFRELQNCDGFVAVMHKRGEVNYSDSPSHYRASVWIQQEIAILHYRSFLLGRPIPMRLYLENGILPEGLTQFSMINPIKFEDTQAILEDLAKWLRGSTFDEPPVLARREDLFRRRIRAYTENHWLLLELIAAHSRNPGDSIDHTILLNDFAATVGESGHEEQLARQLFEDVRVPLRLSGLIIQTEDQRTGQASYRLGTQWWDLVVEELRNRARATSEHT
jgi:hypothetical protein